MNACNLLCKGGEGIERTVADPVALQPGAPEFPPPKQLSQDFGVAISGLLDALHVKLVWEHDRAAQTQGFAVAHPALQTEGDDRKAGNTLPKDVQDMMDSLRKENQELRAAMEQAVQLRAEQHARALTATAKATPSDTAEPPKNATKAQVLRLKANDEKVKGQSGVVGQKEEQITELAKDIVAALKSEPMTPSDIIPEFRKGPRHFLQRASWDLLIKLLMNIVTVLNIVIIGFQAGSDWIGWLVIDIVFCGFFLFEVIHRFSVEGMRSVNPHARDASWHFFDIALVVIQSAEISLGIVALADPDADSPSQSFTWLRTARLIRLCRILRLFQIDFFGDLLLMINGAVGGARTLAFSVLVLTIPVYAFALFLNQTIGTYEATSDFDVGEHFSTMGRSMFSGFRCLVNGDCSAKDGRPMFELILDKSGGWVIGVAYCITSVCMAFGVFNVIVAIYVENTVSSAKSNQALVRQRRLANVARFAEQIVSLARFLWTKKRMQDPFSVESALQMDVERDFFQNVVDEYEMHHLLQDLDVPKEDHLDLFDICDADGSGCVSMEELVAGIKRLRGDPRRSDIVFVMLRNSEILSEMQEMRTEMLAELSSLSTIKSQMDGLMLMMKLPPQSGSAA